MSAHYHMNQQTLRKYVAAMHIGTLGALSMIAFVIVVEVLTGGQSDGLKFLKYLFFAITTAYGLCRLNREREGLYRYLPKSTFYTAVVSLTAAVLTLLAYWAVLPIDGINMATIQTPDGVAAAQLMPLPEPFMLFLEVFAMSMIIGFGLLIYGTDNTHMSDL